jgi:deoxyribodipyrimidine photolyase-related protein
MRAAPVSVWILGDQLLEDHPALAAAEEGACIVLVESRQRSVKLAYQRKKLVLLFSAMRHYAQHLRSRGYCVDYRQAPTFIEALREHIHDQQPTRLVTMAASSYHGRRFQEGLPAHLGLPVEVLPNTQFLSGQFDPLPQAGKRVVMENFYRQMRRHFGLLMEPGDLPSGGAWNYDTQNRQRLPKGLRAPAVMAFAPDNLTRQVIDEVERLPGLGSAQGFELAVTYEQARLALDDFLTNRLPHFGAYEDAMSRDDDTLFHSRLSPYLNLGLLTPLQAARAAETAYRDGRAPLNSVEGFIRQVIGWREYMYWQYWRQMPGLLEANFWQAQRELPGWFWTGETEMACLHRAIQRAISNGYTHHIERLMLLSNFALLAGLRPHQVNQWFLATFIDAYDWVMPPNVLGMGLYADGGQTATKPYIASANYIRKMGDHCQGCRFDPLQRSGSQACPFNYLYWNFVIEHEETLRANPRTSQSTLGLKRFSTKERQVIQEQAAQFLQEMDDLSSP